MEADPVRGWAFLLSGLLLWTAHFFALYIIASIFLTTPLARLLALLVTLACLAAGALLVVRTLRRASPTATDTWMRAVALGGLGLAGVAILWQALPAFLA